MKEEKLFSLQTAHDAIENAMRTCRLNNKNPEQVPFIIKEDWHEYKPFSMFTSFGDKGMKAGIEFFKTDEIKIVAPDVRPEGGGEYWYSRGASTSDVSGYIKSKKAGERLLRFVKYVLEKDEIETWLDYREYEPTYIQFKFSAEEFDVEKLSELAKANNDILTEKIIRQCVK